LPQGIITTLRPIYISASASTSASQSLSRHLIVPV
jgi:hypothetical protein